MLLLNIMTLLSLNVSLVDTKTLWKMKSIAIQKIGNGEEAI